MRRLVTVLTLILVLVPFILGAPAGAQAPIEGELALITPVSKFIHDAALKAFADYAKERWGVALKVSAIPAGTPVAYGRIVEWKGKPDVDIFWGGESALFEKLAEQKLLQKVEISKETWDAIQEFERLGSTRTIRVDVRLVAATNRDLARMVADGQFRADLFYRLNVFPVVLPPLRERSEDIPLLVRHFTQEFARRIGRRIETIPAEVLDALMRYPWPGNVREMQNVIERAVILSRNGRLRIAPQSLACAEPSQKLNGQLDASEREAIETALRATAGRVAGPHGAAQRLGLAHSTLEFRIKKLGIDKFQFRRSTARHTSEVLPRS